MTRFPGAHNTPGNPRDVTDGLPCESGASPECTRQTTWRVVAYTTPTNEWVRMVTCTPCAVELIVRGEMSTLVRADAPDPAVPLPAAGTFAPTLPPRAR